jgi:hypothetical protein
MRIKINQIDFEVTPVPGPVRLALLSDPVLMQAILRDIWEWDAVAKSGKALTPLFENRAAVLPNGLTFFVPRTDAEGRLVKAEAPSTSMAKRFLKATGAKSLNELMGAMNRVVELNRKTVPFEEFRPLNATASYRIRMYTDFSAVKIENAARNLAAYILLPAQVGFHAELGVIPDTAAHEAAVAAGVDVNAMRPGFIVPARAPATLGMRRAALAKAFDELQAELVAQGGPETSTPIQKMRAARLATEWRALDPQPVKTN